jgi:hypothetical protein
VTRPLRAASVAVAALLLAAPPAWNAGAPPRAQSPETFFGFRMGDEGRLAGWDRMVDYLRHLDEASPRLLVHEAGRTTDDRPYLVAIVSEPATLAALDEVRAAQRRLADPRRTPEAEAERIAAEGKGIVLVGAGVHSTETGGSQMMNELLWHLATDESPATARLLRELVMLFVPSQNPDGLQLMADWHARNAGTPFEDAPLPELYHRYAGHDLNRDAFMQTQAETRHLGRLLYRDWLPEVYLDLHQMGPARARMFVPPYRSPANPNIDPLIWTQANVLGQTMASRLLEAGKPGVMWGEIYTGYWQGANSTTTWWHNIVGLLSEVASARPASAVVQDIAPPAPGALTRPPEPPAGQVQLPPPPDTQYRINYPDPWLGGTWTPRDVVEYHRLGTLGLLEGAANNRAMLKRNFYRMHHRTIARFAGGRPAAVVIPRDQHDPGATAELVRVLRAGGAEVQRATSDGTAGTLAIRDGSFIVTLAQPFGRWIKDLLEPQRYPASVSPARVPPAERPYDVTAWSLGLQMGVDVRFVDEPLQGAALEMVETDPATRGRLSGDGRIFAFRREMNASATLANRLLDAGAELAVLTAPAGEHGTEWPAGTFIGRGVDRRALRRAAGETGVDIGTLRSWPRGTAPIRRPRVALVEPWGGSIDAGWTRWVLERHGFAYTRVRPRELADGVAARFDIVIIPEIPQPLLMRGLRGLAVRPAHRGGLGDAGVDGLKAFLRAGGTIVTLGNAAEFAIDALDVPVVVAARGDDPDSAYVPGALVAVDVVPDHPITAGMPARVAAMNRFNNAYAIGRGGEGTVHALAHYADQTLVLSGFASGEERLRGRMAAFEAMMGAGRVVALGVRVQHRGQTWATFKLLFNALLTPNAGRGGDLSVRSGENPAVPLWGGASAPHESGGHARLKPRPTRLPGRPEVTTGG